MNARPRAVNDGDHDWLVERFVARMELAATSPEFAYESGRIDEFCAQNAIADDERDTARREAERGRWA